MAKKTKNGIRAALLSKYTDKRAQKGKRVKYPMVFSGAEGHRYGTEIA